MKGDWADVDTRPTKGVGTGQGRTNWPDKNIVRLIYFDEAGTPAPQPLVVVAAVIIHADTQMRAINKEAADIRNTIPVNHRDSFEFKADRMFRHVKKFGAESRYTKPIKEFLSIMRRFELPIVYQAIKRKGFDAESVKISQQNDGNKPEIKLQAFLSCLMQIETWFRNEAPEEGGLCIADYSPQDRKVQEFGKKLQLYGLKTDIRTWDHIVDSVYFGDSKNSVGIQLADYANFFIKIHLMGDPAAEPFYQIIEPLLYDKYPVMSEFS